MRLPISLLAALLVVSLVPAASAAAPVASAADVARAQAIAVSFWGGSPCGGSVSVVGASLPLGVYALSNWTNPVAPYGNAAANTACVVSFNSHAMADWPMLCTLMIHEYGHLLGHQHSPDPANVMYAEYLGPISQCEPPPIAAAPRASATKMRIKPARHRRPRHRSHRRA